ncbi:hypothetical protein CXF94_12105 [Halomonas sp. Choline-3u-9]|uniref:TOPRIM nucleotidyl transferase/hydrolase domain-containing protein n=2 Tax=Halomonas TaxID=2745 RepID=UPI000485AB63|nr:MULTISPECIES: TOPRIM nucleotidyl transferase/hydrolase domain-containing protein [unclassified Halomonas]NAO97978.1 hypothetical protein [Halomonas sp. MG34]PKH61046.1 hypothetical protein CXF94_12105 [Halomonas sp. Choline-3u-9]
MNYFSLFKKFGRKKALEIIKQALRNGKDHGLERSFNVNKVAIANNTILVSYESKVSNRFFIYNDFALIIGFIYSFLLDEFKEQRIHNIGVKSNFPDNGDLYILSPIDSAKAIAEGNAIYWLKNSIVNEHLTYPADSYLLVEGESEMEAFPILFRSINVEIEQYKIKLLPYSKHNLKTMLAVLKLKKEPFFLVCDQDKENEMMDLKREGLLSENFHILKRGELEDYINPEALISILKNITPDIDMKPDYIEENRSRRLGTSKIIAKYYHQESIQNQNPTKPLVAIKIAQFWVENEIPSEFFDIMNRTINLTNN